MAVSPQTGRNTMRFHSHQRESRRGRPSVRAALAVSISVMVIGMVTGVGCSSSEETGAARGNARNQQAGPIVGEPLPDTSQSMVSHPGAIDVRSRDPQVGDPAVRRGRDTVRASTHRVSRSADVRTPLVKPPDAMYTVQVGAYRRASNALAIQKILKKEHGELPVFNIFAQREGLYRVTIGKFETLREATNFRNTLVQQHPKRFGECWVTYIERSRSSLR